VVLLLTIICLSGAALPRLAACDGYDFSPGINDKISKSELLSMETDGADLAEASALNATENPASTECRPLRFPGSGRLLGNKIRQAIAKFLA
jgi:hypothetical protein